MNYKQFTEKTRNLNYFRIESLAVFPGHRRTLKNQLVAWQRRERVHKLRRGIYTLNDDDRRVPLPRLMVSNILHAPSYVSLEFAMAHYGLIPERVTAVTAVTPRKTAMYRNVYGDFSYRSLKKDRFFGFRSVTEEGLPVLIATPEKAVLDKIYFDPSFLPREDYFLENLRLQNYETLRLDRLCGYARRFGYRKVREGADVLASLVRSERR